MKDLRLLNSSDALIGTIRVDMLSNNPANFTIMEIKDATGKIVDNLKVIAQFKQRLPESWIAFKAYCAANSIQIDGADSNGSNASTLLFN